MRRGDVVLVWGRRLGRVVRTSGTGPGVPSPGDPNKRVAFRSPSYPKRRTLVVLLDGTDPPAGYSAWFDQTDLGPAPQAYQLALPL